jgi:hypothetical protein
VKKEFYRFVVKQLIQDSGRENCVKIVVFLNPWLSRVRELLNRAPVKYHNMVDGSERREWMMKEPAEASPKAIRDDLIWGIKAIAREINRTERQAFPKISSIRSSCPQMGQAAHFSPSRSNPRSGGT